MIKRDIFDSVRAHLSQKEITLIVGPRQAGKTTLMKALESRLSQHGERSLFLSLDTETDYRFFVSQVALIQKIELEIGTAKGYVFIDEINRKENAGLFLKGIYDMDLPYKFIISGSGSLELKEKIHESLAGRKRVFELGTVSFQEFVNFKTKYAYENKLSEFFDLHPLFARRFLEEYTNFGGYPRVIIADRRSEKEKIIAEIFQSYIEKDLSYLLNVQKTENFAALVRLISSQIGSLVHYAELSATLGLSYQTVKNYLWYLEKTFILKKVAPFFKNIRKELTKSPVYYFCDVGMRNYIAGRMGDLLQGSDAGFVFQNFVFGLLQNRLPAGLRLLNFWRTKDGAEVDFVISSGNRVLPIEVKFQEMKNPTIKRSLRSFLHRYKPTQALVANLSLEEETREQETIVSFLPFWKISEAMEEFYFENA